MGWRSDNKKIGEKTEKYSKCNWRSFQQTLKKCQRSVRKDFKSTSDVEGNAFLFRAHWRQATVQSLLLGSDCGYGDGRCKEKGALQLCLGGLLGTVHVRYG